MKYKGRVAVLLSSIVSAALWTCYFYFTYGFNDECWNRITIALGIHIAYGICVWWAGWKYDKLTICSEKDPLTHLYNRRYVYSNFNKLVAKTDKNKGKLNVFVIDINDFKRLNDTYGHETGDKVIQAISASLLQNARKTDIVARWGGDEFLLLIPYAKRLHVNKLLERTKKDLEGMSREAGIPISIAAGRAVYPDEAKGLSELIELADRNMYISKEEKKSSVMGGGIHHAL